MTATGPPVDAEVDVSVQPESDSHATEGASFEPPVNAELGISVQPESDSNPTVGASAEAPTNQCPNRISSGSHSRTGSRAGSRGSRCGSRGSRNGSRGSFRGGSRGSCRSLGSCPHGAGAEEPKRPNTSDGQKARPPRPEAEPRADVAKAPRPGTVAGVSTAASTACPGTVAAVSTATSTTCQLEDHFPPPPPLADSGPPGVEENASPGSGFADSANVGEVLGDAVRDETSGGEEPKLKLPLTARRAPGFVNEELGKVKAAKFEDDYSPNPGRARKSSTCMHLDQMGATRLTMARRTIEARRSVDESPGTPISPRFHKPHAAVHRRSKYVKRSSIGDILPESMLSGSDESPLGEYSEDEEKGKVFGANRWDAKAKGPPVPCLRRLCDQCLATPIDDKNATFPSKRSTKLKHSVALRKLKQKDMRKSLKHMQQMQLGLEMAELNWDTIEITHEIERSYFSKKPHPRLPLLTQEGGFRLEVRIRQEKVKEPLLKESIADLAGPAFQDRCKELKEDLERSALRVIVNKPMHLRKFEESVHLIGYLRKRVFFRELPITVLNEITKYLKVVRFRLGQTIFKGGQETTGVYILLKGVVAFPNASERLRDEENSQPGDTGVTRRGGISGPAGGSLKNSEDQEILRTPFLGDHKPPGKPEYGREMSDEISGGGNVLAVDDILENMGWPPVPKETKVHMFTAVAASPVEALFCPAARLIPLIEEESLREKITVLQEYFPPTKGWQEKVLSLQSRVEKNGRRLQIHELFEISDVYRNQVLYQGGEKTPLDVARVCVIVSGTANLKARGRVVDTAHVGAVLGEEVLRDATYTHTAQIITPTARIMSIRACDYLAQFERGGNRRMQSMRTLEFDESDTSSDELNLKAQDEDHKRNSLEKEPQSPLGSRGRKTLQFSNDAQAVRARPMFKFGRTFNNGRASPGPRASMKMLTEEEWAKYAPKKLPPRIKPMEDGKRQREEDFTDETVRKRQLKRGMTRQTLARMPDDDRSIPGLKASRESLVPAARRRESPVPSVRRTLTQANAFEPGRVSIPRGGGFQNKARMSRADVLQSNGWEFGTSCDSEAQVIPKLPTMKQSQAQQLAVKRQSGLALARGARTARPSTVPAKIIQARLARFTDDEDEDWQEASIQDLRRMTREIVHQRFGFGF